MLKNGIYKGKPIKKYIFLLFGLSLLIGLCTPIIALEIKIEDTALINLETKEIPQNELSLSKGQLNPIEESPKGTEKDYLDRIFYQNIKPNVDLEYLTYDKKIKENIILKSKPTENTFNLSINLTGYNYKKYDWGLLILDGTKTVGSFANPYVVGGDYLPYTFDGKTYSIDTKSIIKSKEYTYPLIIDPTYDIWDSSIDTLKWDLIDCDYSPCSTAVCAETTTGIYSGTTKCFSSYERFFDSSLRTTQTFFEKPAVIKGEARLIAGACSGGSEASLYFGTYPINYTNPNGASLSADITFSFEINSKNYSNISIITTGDYASNKLFNGLTYGATYLQLNSARGDNWGCLDSFTELHYLNYTFYPNVSDAYFVVTDVVNKNLKAYCVATEYGGYNINLSYSIYKNGIINKTGDFVNISSGIINLTTILNSSYTNTNWTISCNATSYDNSIGQNLKSNNYVSGITPLNAYAYVCLIDEKNNSLFNVNNITSAKAYDDFNSVVYNFKNESVCGYLSASTGKIRIELCYPGQECIMRHINLNLLLEESTVRICANTEGTTHYEQIITSSTQRPALLKSLFSNCYVAADYTQYAYQGSYILKAYTINTVYYLYQVSSGTTSYLSSLDGSIQSYYDLDTLIFRQSQSPIYIKGDTLAVSKHPTSDKTLLVSYINYNYDNEYAYTEITNYDDGLILFYANNTLTPNSFIINFDYSSINVTNSTVFHIKVIATNSIDTHSIEKDFLLNASSGNIDPRLAFTLSIFLLFFGLTFASARTTLSWFGIIIEIGSIIILTLAPLMWYSKLLMAMEFVILIYTGIIMMTVNQPNNIGG